jgi:hypothetical protein
MSGSQVLLRTYFSGHSYKSTLRLASLSGFYVYSAIQMYANLILSNPRLHTLEDRSRYQAKGTPCAEASKISFTKFLQNSKEMTEQDPWF